MSPAKHSDERVSTILGSLLLIALAAGFAFTMVMCNTGCGPGFEIERFGTMKPDAADDGGLAPIPLDASPTTDGGISIPDVITTIEASTPDAAPTVDAINDAEDASTDTCVAASSTTPPANCPTMGPADIPMNYLMIQTLTGQSTPTCNWQPTPANCRCAYDCGCVMRFHGSNCACKIDNLGLMEVTCQ